MLPKYSFLLFLIILIGIYHRVHATPEKLSKSSLLSPSVAEEPFLALIHAVKSYQKGDGELAEESFHQSFQKEPRAASAYFLGNMFLKIGRPHSAGVYFEKAAILFGKEDRRQRIPRKEEKDGLLTHPLSKTFSYSLSPALCPKNAEELDKKFTLDWFEYIMLPRFASLRKYFFQNKIKTQDALLSAYSAYVLLPERRDSLKLVLRKLVARSSSTLSMEEKNLFLLPLASQSHQNCIHRLAGITNMLKQKIQKGGSSYLLKKKKNFVDYHLERSYKNYVTLLPGVQSAYAFGTYYSQKRNFIPALHLLRSSLAFLGVQLKRLEKKEGALSQLNLILLTTQRIYSGLGRSQDAKVLQSISRILESYLSNPDHLENRKWKQSIFRECRSKLQNRECLVILREQAKKGSVSYNFYDQILKKRDLQWEEKELLRSSPFILKGF